jgi:hypothetical protein
VIRWLRSANDSLPEAPLALGRAGETPGLVAAAETPAPGIPPRPYAKGIFS